MMHTRKGPVLITGGSGFIGENLINSLMNEYSLIVLDKVRPQHLPHDVEFINCDITSKSSVRQALSYVKKTKGEYLFSVIHLIAYYDPENPEDSLYDDINVKGTQNLVHDLFQNFDVGQFIYSSSMSVYRPQKNKLTEDSPLNPAWGYPRTKIKCEEIIRDASLRIPSVILRIAAVYDEFGRAPGIVREIRSVYEMSFSSLFSSQNESNRQSSIHIDDLTTVFQKILEMKGQLPSGLILNVAEERPLTFNEIRRIISHELPDESSSHRIPPLITDHVLQLKRMFVKEPLEEYAYANYHLDTSLLKKTINWVPEHSLQFTLPKMIEYLVNYPGTWYRINKLERKSIVTDLRKKVLKPVLHL